MSKIKRILFLLLFILLVYTRFVNLSWGLPHPMHPDERNMANAIQNLKCDRLLIFSNRFSVKECMNPHFFAYGQLPLYLGYGIVLLMKFFDGDLGRPISFEEAAFSLRLISAVASIFTVLIMLRIVNLFLKANNSEFRVQNSELNLKLRKKILNYGSILNSRFLILTLLVFTFAPFFIQFSHFGTTESLLMFFYSAIVYVSLKYSYDRLLTPSFLLLASLFSSLAIATKISSVIFLIIPATLIIDQRKKSFLVRSLSIVYLFILTLVLSVIFSPHNFISFPEFLGSMAYESDVAFGTYRAFYTRQFEGVSPIVFQFFNIFPYALGWPVFVFFLLGFVLLPFRREYNLLRLAALVGFLSNAFLYAKWTRFVSPIFPLMLVIAVLFIFRLYFLTHSWINSNIKAQISKPNLKSKKFLNFALSFALCILIFALILPGISYLSIYQNPDVRFTASEWIYQNIPDGSYILFETANVVDIPITDPKSQIPNPKQIQNPNYQMVSFNFYELDANPQLQAELQSHLARADYIFVPSRRVFANHYCPLSLSFRGSETTEKSSEGASDVPEAFLRPDNIWTRFLPFDFAQGRNDSEEERCRYFRKKYPLLNDYYDRLFSGELGFEKVAEFSSYPNFKFQISNFKFNLEFPDEEAEETWTVFDHPVIRIYKRINRDFGKNKTN